MSDAMPPLPLSLALAAAGRRAQAALDDVLAELGVSSRHLAALGHVSRDPDLSTSDLARRSGVTAQSMHATIRELVDMGAMSRDAAGRGRRAALAVTDHGRALVRDGMAAVHRADDILLAEVGELPPGTLQALGRLGFDPER